MLLKTLGMDVNERIRKAVSESQRLRERTKALREENQRLKEQLAQIPRSKKATLKN